ncbi:kit ligand a isoform X2 [Callorhinchus milii]|uniref:kit ligand a isoform X2 n=1 Tax=Callorhinchus milii TaxID=7868 RepID=UPI0004574733|nr:kit ligand a isoform X2 [Callorhinchus milii]|eukprot:gi/632955531/ref/XP_007893508.1/ PREDICTED: kit ligand isoform X2 [Callorhinchus milii]
MKKANTLINSIIYLQLFLTTLFGENICQKGNPVTDDIKDIDKLVGNLPSDYSIEINFFPKIANANDSCWMYLTVPEMSLSLDSLLRKFAENSSNYLIIKKLQRIMDGIYSCLVAASKDLEEMDYDCESSSRKPTDYFDYFREIVNTFQRADNNCPCDSEVVCSRIDPTTPGRGSNSTAHVLEQSNKTRASKCERIHPELARPGRAKRHILTASEHGGQLAHSTSAEQSSVGSFQRKEDPTTEIPFSIDSESRIEDPGCRTSVKYLIVVIVTILSTVSLSVPLTCLAVRLKQRRRNRENQSQPEERREENEVQTQFMCEPAQSMT